MDLAALFTAENAAALVTLTALEIVLGIDNIVFITIILDKVPEEKRARIRTVGLLLAVVMRIALLLGISWVMGLQAELFAVLRWSFSGKDLILLVGGLFLVAKATWEIHHKTQAPPHRPGAAARAASGVTFIIVQIILLDLVFSLDSVITAIGMARAIPVMVLSVLIAVGTMIAFAGAIGRFVDRHPALKMLALAFLVLIGVMLVAEGLGEHIRKGYIYFAMAFALGVEVLNIRAGSRAAARSPDRPDAPA